jgi:regulator of cell morphogenesis and NO signaling
MNITKEKTVAEVVTENVGADHVFSKYKIDFCCGGGMKLEDACKESGVSFETVKQEIEDIKNIIAGDSDLTSMDVLDLIKHATTEYHEYFDEAISQLSPLAAKVAEVHAQEHPEVVKVNILFSKVVSEISEQISLEENVLFPFIEKFRDQEKSFTENEKTITEILEKSINSIESVLATGAENFKLIANTSSNYTLPVGACNSYTFLYKNLEEFEHKLHKYIHFEKNILFPKLLNLK